MLTPREYAESVIDGTAKLELVHTRHTVEPKICELCGRNFSRNADVPMKERARECGACPPRKTKFA